MNIYAFEAERPVIQTKAGLLRGMCFGGVEIFLGVKYGTAKRFQMAQEIEPWEGIKNCYAFGATAMQMRQFSGRSFAFPFERGSSFSAPQSEDCLHLNVWAPKRDGSKKPVFVYMHGGGFFQGASTESTTFDGFTLAHEEGTVVVTMNHRLNLMGHLNLADYGEEFKYSKNVGIFDLVLCLKWIHENIAAFGGDPDNVTLCGHSGGGGKVLSMYQIEEAKDYFARGICMSGVLDNGPETGEEDSRKMAKAICDELGITKETKDKLYEVPFEDILAAYRKVTPQLIAAGININMAPLKDDIFMGFPVQEGGFAAWSKDKPLMLCTVFGEFNEKVSIPDEVKETITEQGKLDMLRERFGARYMELVELFQKTYPTHDILDLMYLDSGFRVPSTQTAHIKASQSKEDNTYMYLFAANMPVNGWIPAWHGCDVAYMFLNADRIPGENPPIYGEQYCKAFRGMVLGFTKNGDPNSDALPAWKPFTTDHHYTMVLDKKCELKEAFDEELLKLYMELCPVFNFNPITR